MNFHRSLMILLAITATLILITDRINAEETEETDDTIFDCTGELLERSFGDFRNLESIRHNLKRIKIPKRFDAREKWPFCKSLHHIKFQGRCGGCWAFATSSVMADRVCIATDGKFNSNLSEQDLLECCRFCVAKKGGCKGGYSYEAFEYWREHGLVTVGCKPTEKGITKGIAQEECRPKCTNENYTVLYKTDKTFSAKTLRMFPIEKTDIQHIMAEIMLNGPVYGGIKYIKYFRKVPPDGILKTNESLIKGVNAGGHAIKILGWDNINGTPVWIIANSWGRRWCNKGFCYVRRGYNDFDMEKQFFVGVPKLKRAKKKGIERPEHSDSNIIKIANPIEIAVILCILTM